MKDLADLLADEDTVLRGYIAVTGVRIVGHKYMGPDRTLSISFAENTELLGEERDDVLVCLVEKARGKAPQIYPVVSAEDAED